MYSSSYSIVRPLGTFRVNGSFGRGSNLGLVFEVGLGRRSDCVRPVGIRAFASMISSVFSESAC